jgi:hypothetical protein
MSVSLKREITLWSGHHRSGNAGYEDPNLAGETFVKLILYIRRDIGPDAEGSDRMGDIFRKR